MTKLREYDGPGAGESITALKTPYHDVAGVAWSFGQALQAVPFFTNNYQAATYLGSNGLGEGTEAFASCFHPKTGITHNHGVETLVTASATDLLIDPDTSAALTLGSDVFLALAFTGSGSTPVFTITDHRSMAWTLVNSTGVDSRKIWVYRSKVSAGAVASGISVNFSATEFANTATLYILIDEFIGLTQTNPVTDQVIATNTSTATYPDNMLVFNFATATANSFHWCGTDSPSFGYALALL